MLYFLPVFLLYMYYDYLSPTLVARFGENWAWENGSGRERFMIAKDQEPVEFIMSLGVALSCGDTSSNELLGRPMTIGLAYSSRWNGPPASNATSPNACAPPGSATRRPSRTWISPRRVASHETSC
jgi:hypothetical protein